MRSVSPSTMEWKNKGPIETRMIETGEVRRGRALSSRSNLGCIMTYQRDQMIIIGQDEVCTKCVQGGSRRKGGGGA